MRRISAIRIATALAVMLLGAASAVAAQPALAADAEVEIDQFAFVPQRITVKAGTIVTWVNEDDTVASSSKLFKSKALDTQDHVHDARRVWFDLNGTVYVLSSLSRAPEAAEINRMTSSISSCTP
jgi:plastocyanin